MNGNEAKDDVESLINSSKEFDEILKTRGITYTINYTDEYKNEIESFTITRTNADKSKSTTTTRYDKKESND